MKMVIFRIFLLIFIQKTESAKCLLKFGFGLKEDVYPKLVQFNPILAETQSSDSFDLDGCKTSCEETVLGLLYI